jgi:hypothetical protein
MNVRLLRRIQRQLLKEPDSYDQNAYVDTHTTDAGVCHTRACIAGWACLLSGKSVNDIRFSLQQLLGLTLKADRLFSPIEGPRFPLLGLSGMPDNTSKPRLHGVKLGLALDASSTSSAPRETTDAH